REIDVVVDSRILRTQRQIAGRRDPHLVAGDDLAEVAKVEREGDADLLALKGAPAGAGDPVIRDLIITRIAESQPIQAAVQPNIIGHDAGHNHAARSYGK